MSKFQFLEGKEGKEKKKEGKQGDSPDSKKKDEDSQPVENTVESPVDTQQEGVAHAQLADAWGKLAMALVKSTRDAVEFQAMALKIPEWQLVCGLVAQMHVSGSLCNPLLDPAWQTSNPVAQLQSVCKLCGKEFKPKWRGQVYCTNECGMKVEEAERARRIKAVQDELHIDLMESLAAENAR